MHSDDMSQLGNGFGIAASEREDHSGASPGTQRLADGIQV